MAPGQAVINTNGDIVGVWNGTEVISSDVLKQAVALYFNNAQAIKRPQFGFSYQMITENNSKLTGVPEGALVKETVFPSAARLGGLIAGDVIIAVSEEPVRQDAPLEEILQKYKAGDQIYLTVLRKNETLNLSLTAGELK